MDLNSLKDQVSNLTLYDLKAGVRKVQNGKMGQKDSRVGQAYRKICSGNELYGNGGKGKSISLSGGKRVWANGRQGPRSHKQRALGGIIDADARNLKRNP